MTRPFSGRDNREPHDARFAMRLSLGEEYFDVASDVEDWGPRYNLAPTQTVPVIRQHPEKPERDLSIMRWGLIPSWAKDSTGAARMINARSETAATLPAFRDPFKFRRCLIPADGFYEWQRKGPTKQPYCFEVDDGGLFAFAGLWGGWKRPDGQWITSFSILTTKPNAVTSAIHDRMPVILTKEDYDMWLDPGLQNPAIVGELLRSFDARRMRCYPASNRINQVQNDDAECAAPITPSLAPQGQLFG